MSAPFAVEDPATLEVIAKVEDQGPEDAIRAVDRAAAALDGWSGLAPRHRSELLRSTYQP